MENGTSFSDILNSEPEVDTEAQQGQPRDEQGRFAPVQPAEEQGETQQELQQEAPPASETEPSHIPIAALKDERSKRQRIEAEHQQALERLQQYENFFAQQQAQPQAEEIDPEQDPIEFLVQQVLARVGPQTQEQQFKTHVHVSEQFARTKWPDYDQKVEIFREACQRQPVLWEAMKEAADPASYAYNAASNILAARNLGDSPPPSREQLEAEIRQQIMAEIGVNPSAPAVPTSLANQQSRGSRGGPAWSGPTPLSSILGG